jgi:hypothetical protein
MSNFNVDEITLSCLVNRKHQKHFVKNKTDESFMSTSFQESIQENLPYLVQRFEYYCTNTPKQPNVQHHLEKLIELLLRERNQTSLEENDMNASLKQGDHCDENDDENEDDGYDRGDEDDDDYMFGSNCKDMISSGQARQPSTIEYWKMQQVFKRPSRKNLTM